VVWKDSLIVALSDPELWRRLEECEFTMSPIEPVPRRFGGTKEILSVRRLVEVVRESSALSSDQCDVLVDEYRRFIYLMAVAGLNLEPPPLVDFAWQRHREDDKAYDGEVRRLLFDSTPNASGLRSPVSAGQSYSETFLLYIKEFDVAPPTKVWPRPAIVRHRLGFFLVVGAGLAAAVAGREWHNAWLTIAGLLVCVPTGAFLVANQTWSLSRDLN
jgi:hypothetical protein